MHYNFLTVNWKVLKQVKTEYCQIARETEPRTKHLQTKIVHGVSHLAEDFKKGLDVEYRTFMNAIKSIVGIETVCVIVQEDNEMALCQQLSKGRDGFCPLCYIKYTQLRNSARRKKVMKMRCKELKCSESSTVYRVKIRGSKGIGVNKFSGQLLSVN